MDSKRITAVVALGANGTELTDVQSTKIELGAELYAWDGLGQAADMLPIPPENTDVERFIVNFFGKHLGHGRGAAQNRLRGKAIIVIGSGTGIGAATVRRLAAEGARVCLADINMPAAEAVAAEVRQAGGEAFTQAIDIADEESVNRAISVAVDRLGGLDAAHVNAADLKTIHEDSDSLAEDLAVFDRTIAVNLRGHLLCTRAMVPHMLSRGRGAIVYTISGSAQAGEPVRPAYAASKAGLHALMRHVATRWGNEGITANCVAPGRDVTPEMAASGQFPEELVEHTTAPTPVRRLGQVSDIPGAVAMLVSDDARWITGQVFNVTGHSSQPGRVCNGS